MRQITKVTNNCIKNNCVKIKKDRTCLAFTDPEYQWRNNNCYGYTNNIWDLRRIFDAIWNYKPQTTRLTKYFSKGVAECLDYHEED
jgi:hypothetical protein